MTYKMRGDIIDVSGDNRKKSMGTSAMKIKRKRQKLVLTSEECCLIKGLIVHTDLNDQMIVAIFSHLSRTINHREISYFRDPDNKKYKTYTPAPKADVERFLARYDRLERLAKSFGVIPQEAYFQLVQKASEAMRAAVSCFNNPGISWKSELFIVNAVIAWTYLMHAHYMTKSVSFVYIKDGKPVLTDEGRPKHWELTRCINVRECPLPEAVKANLKYLIAVRNEIEHRISDNVDRLLEPKLQACALNFNYWMCEWFGAACSIAQDLAFAIQFAEISLRKNEDIVGAKGLPDSIQAANTLVENDMDPAVYNDPRYSYRVFVVPRTVNNKSKADQAVVYAEPGSAVELAVREVERPKYTPSQIVAIMKAEGFRTFTLYGKDGFVPFWKSIDGKDPKKALGVEVAGTWYWYDKMVGEVRTYLTEKKEVNPKSAV